MALSRPEKTRRPLDLPSDASRRSFLIRSGQGALAALLPFHDFSYPFFRSAAAPAHQSATDLHLQPHYRSQRPLDDVLLKAKAGLDEFITEKYADQIAAILAKWSAGLLQSPSDVNAIGSTFTADFTGSSLISAESKSLRSGPPVEVVQRTFKAEATLGREVFLQQLRGELTGFSKILTADFQVISISSDPARLQTRIHYELVGARRDVFREQRVGNWDLSWQADDAGSFRLRSWQAIDDIVSRSASPVFADVTGEVLGRNQSYDSQLLRGSDYWRTVLDGACGIDIYGHNGVSVGDIDGDGFDDLYLCQPGGLPNRLYRNRGDGTFEDITESSGVGVLENTACALFADIDNDGRQDLIVVRANGPLLFMNQGGGKFRQKLDAFQFATPPQGTFTGAAIADYDRDGWLDIYFCLYVYYQGADQYKYPLPYYDANNGPRNFLLQNNRDATFRDVTAKTGLDQNNTRYSFCCGWNDYNHDGWPDLYVVNDFGRKNLYRNNGDGTFTDVAAQAGVEDIGAGMSVCWLDYDSDGADDLYVANMWTAAGERVAQQDIFKKDAPEQVRALYRKHAMGNSLFRNAPREKFQNVTAAAGVGLGRWAWSSDAWDFDHDGLPDLYITNGMVSGPSREDLNSFFWRQVVARSPDEFKPSHEYEQGWNAINELIRADGTWSGFERNVFYANNRDGTFSDVSGAVGLDFLEDGRAFALADFDHDGRQEVFLKNRNAPQLRVLKNVMQDLPPSISFRLRGTKSNRDAIGAVVTIESESRRQTRSVQAGSGFLSQHSKELFFGLGATKSPVRAEIRWPGGLVQELHDLQLNHRVWVEEGSPSVRSEPYKMRSAVGATVEERPFRAASSAENDGLQPRWPDAPLPATIETWLLAPVSAPDVSLPDHAGKTHTLAALRGQPVLLNFWTAASPQCQADLRTFSTNHFRWSVNGLQLLTINVDAPEVPPAAVRAYSIPVLRATDDLAAIYNILYRLLFDRHRDLPLPTTFLIDKKGDIVKIYQGPINATQIDKDLGAIPQTLAARLKLALPFPGVTEATDFTRNYLSYGSVFFQRGYFDQAGAAFQRALEDDPESAEALYGLGSVQLNQQKTAEARASFERAVKLRASYPDTLANAWNNLGLLAARETRSPDGSINQSLTQEAIADFEQALRLSPDHVVALVNLGSAHRQLKHWDEARRAFDRALAVSPNDPEANYGAGMVLAQTAVSSDDTARAEQHLQRALQSRPAYPEALNNLGILYLRTQRRDEAVAKFEECIRVAPEFDQAYLNLARVYIVEGAPDKARVVLEELLKVHPGQAEGQKMLRTVRQ